MNKFVVNSTHAEHLADGQMLAPGQEVTLSAEAQREPHNERLIQTGVLSLPVEADAPQDEATDDKEEGDT